MPPGPFNEKRASDFEKVYVSFQDGNTALHIATRMGHEKLVDMLLEAGSIVTTKNNVRRQIDADYMNNRLTKARLFQRADQR